MRCAAVFADRHKPHIWSESARKCAHAPQICIFNMLIAIRCGFLHVLFIRTHTHTVHTIHTPSDECLTVRGFHEQSTLALNCGMQSVWLTFVLLVPVVGSFLPFLSLSLSLHLSHHVFSGEFLPSAALCWRCRVLDRSQLNVLNLKHPIHAYTIDCSEQN